MANEEAKRARPQLLSTPEAADFLGVQPHTLEVWRSTRRYRLPYILVGNRVRYRLEVLERFLQERTVGDDFGAEA